MTPADKKKIVQEFAAKTRSGESGIQEEVSVNQDTGIDTGALLQGDSNEEIRMQDRLIEKAENAKQGKMQRVTVADIRPSQKNSRDDEEEQLLLPGA